MKRVVVTGMGAITPLGNDVNSFWDKLKSGQTGIDFISKFDTENFKVKLAAEVKDFNPEKYMERKETKRMDLFCQYALNAAGEAMDDSGIDIEKINQDRFGVIVGSGIGGFVTIQEQIVKMHEKGVNRMAPLFIPMIIGNMAAGNIAIKYSAKGICTSVVTACATGNNCIGEAFRNIKYGHSDIIIAGGTEASIIESGIAGFMALTALSESSDPNRASIPFDKDRNGFVMGEGAGILILEELEHALKRGAKIYGEVVGYGSNCDAYHMTSPTPDGSGGAKAMKLAMEEANTTAEEIGYINAHGTSTEANDPAETSAIKIALDDAAYSTHISSTKSMTGHLLGAAGAIEAIACIKALEEGFLPPTANLKETAEGCDLNYIPVNGIEKNIKYALSTSLGFGGHNAVLCMKKWEGK